MKQNMEPNFSFSRRMGNTTFTVNVFCAQDTDATYETKLLELIRNDPAIGKQGEYSADTSAA